MSVYSSPAEINEFMGELGPNPFFIYDMDGNALIGYKVAEGRELPLNTSDNPKNQSMPFGLSRTQIDALVADGTLKESIFAGKTMDVRLPQPLVNFINKCVDEDEPFKIGILTSRSEFEAKKILTESGVGKVDAVTLVADSGGILNIQGKQEILRPLTEEEEEYRRTLDAIGAGVQDMVDELVRKHMGAAAPIPKLYVEHKGIGTNIHWRSILEASKQGDGSPLDHEIGALLQGLVKEYSKRSPVDEMGNAVFKMLDGPATVELKIASVNKGIGLSMLMAHAAEHHARPSAFVFSGDDYSKGNGQPGTDYFAARETEALSIKYGIPGYNILTLHPVNADINALEPDLSHMVDTLAPEFERPQIHLIVRTPRENGELVLRAYGESLTFGRAPAVGKPDAGAACQL